MIVAGPGAAPARTGSREPWGRYLVYGEIASGGMATVEFGRLLGPLGFSRPVAIKRLHERFARDPDVVAMFLDEARLSSRFSHANVIPTLDVATAPGELALIMEYVPGESLARVLELAASRGQRVPVPIAAALMASVLHGLHAAHEARGEHGEALEIVHRDVSPENILVGADGVPRVFDFGIAKAIGRIRSTPNGEVKGKLAYIAPEQLQGLAVDRRTDVYGASVVLFEIVTGRQLFDGPTQSAILHAVLNHPVPTPSSLRSEAPAALDRIVLRGLARDPDARFPSAQAMALALEREVGSATQSELCAFLQQLAGDQLAERSARLRAMVDRAERETARPSAARARARRSLLLLVLGAAALAATLFSLSRTDDVFVARPLPQPALPSSEPAIAPEPQVADDSALRAAPASPPPRAASAPAPVAASNASARPRPAGAGPRGTAKAGCMPPYVVDRIGVRHPKPECL